MNIHEVTERMNRWGRDKVPFLFVVDFEMKNAFAHKLDEIDPKMIMFDIHGFSNVRSSESFSTFPQLTVHPSSFDDYRTKFEQVYEHLSYGDSYLANLTVKTAITLNCSLTDLFFHSKARYKLYLDNRFLVFSPEIFVQIADGKIFSYPMKGTIDATIPNAEKIILGDIKELAEHVTIVDLIRNDLSQVASNVEVTRFRYIDEIRTSDKKLLQVSSEIKGILPDDYSARLGEILLKLLPAGSVTGAPKEKTVEIIRHAEGEDRGYYTGVFGYFDGTRLDSGVMIRFIEKKDERYFYRSGGGITTQSVVSKEYKEVIDKVYVPVD